MTARGRNGACPTGRRLLPVRPDRRGIQDLAGRRWRLSERGGLLWPVPRRQPPPRREPAPLRRAPGLLALLDGVAVLVPFAGGLRRRWRFDDDLWAAERSDLGRRSEEHTAELQP